MVKKNSKDKDKVLSTLKGIDQQECRRVMVDYDSFINRVQHEMYVQAFIDLFRKNEKTDNKALSDEDLRDFINNNVYDIYMNSSVTNSTSN